MADTEIPTCIPTRLTPDQRRKVYAELLRIHSRFLEKRLVDECMRESYDTLAKALADTEPLTETLLAESIPGWVFEWAVAIQWVPYPPRKVVYEAGNLLERRMPRTTTPPVPEQELTEMLGCLKMTVWYKADIMKRLASRIAFWSAEAILRDSSGEPKFANESVPKKAGGCSRSSEVETLIRQANERSRTRIYKRHLWLSIGHTKGRQFEYWQACSSNATESDEQNFGRIIREGPDKFLGTLRRKGLIPADH